MITSLPDIQTAVRLSQLGKGRSARLASTTLPVDEGETLRAMGLRPECELRVCKIGEPCIVTIGPAQSRCRIALARRVAEQLHVRPC